MSNRVGATTWLDADHRRHAVCGLAIRDLKAGAGLAHLPSGRFAANAAWLLAATLAHSLLRWTPGSAWASVTSRPSQDAAPYAACAARPAYLLRAAVDAAPTRQLAVGPLVHMALARLRCIP